MQRASLMLWLAAAQFWAPATSAQSAVVLDGNGQLLGAYAGSTQSALVDVLTPTGYAATLATTRPSYFGGEPWGPTHEGAACSGTPYTTYALRGIVSRDRQDLVWYVPRDASPVTRPVGTMLSFRSSSGACSSFTTTGPMTLIPIAPNDEAVTGIPSSFAAPLSIVPAAVFANGYEHKVLQQPE